ncbi:MAG: ABC transporter ATP-binding protein [Hyphomicrobiaceae bacterium]
MRIDARASALLKRFLKDWVRGRIGELAVCFALMAVVAAASGAYGLIVKYAFNALGGGDFSSMWPIIGAILGITMARSLALYLQVVVTNKTVMRMTVELQKAVYAHLLKADFARLARDTPGHLVSRLTNDIQAIQLAATAALNTSVRDILTIIATVGVMFYIDPVLTLIVLGIYPVAVLPVMRMGQRLRRVARRTQAELADMTAGLSESLGGVRLIKTFRLEDYAGERTNSSFDQIYRLRMKAIRARAALDPMLEALGGLALAGVTAFVGYRLSSGVSSIGDFMGFVAALLQAAQPIRGFGNLNARVQEGLGALERVYEMLDEKPRIVDRPDARPLEVSAGAIGFHHVTFAYDANVPAIRDFSLEVKGGTTVALVGRSGAGKTTVINLVPRLFEPQEGTIAIDGQEIRDVTIASLRQSISIVSQDITLFNDTVRQNIALGRLGASDEEIFAAAEAAAAHRFIRALPNGYDTVIGDRGMRLSGGQRQRLALARAILKNAPILLLDEATSALDTESERLVQDALERFSRGRTTLVIAHRLSTVQGADLICVMDEGRAVETGTHRELIARDGIYAMLCRTQFLAAATLDEG